MTYSASGTLNGKTARYESATAKQLAQIVAEMHEAGVSPVRIREDGRVIESSEEWEEILRNEH